MNTSLTNLFSPIDIGPVPVRNRIVSTGHHTYLADKQPGDALIAYHEARARGGAGLIISEIVAVHETAGFSRNLLAVETPEAEDAYRQLVEACHRHECKLFAQLFHPGREILSSWSGLAPIAWAPSAVGNERFHIMPKPMSIALIEDVIAGFGESAARLAAAGIDGVEIVGSQGYLPAQFLNPVVNRRDDDYGGDFDRRLRFVSDLIDTIRERAPGLALGLRLSANDYEPDGLDESAMTGICVALQDRLDYFSLVAGSSATLGASVHIVPAMGFDPAYVAPLSQVVRERVDKPVIVTGRINQPQVAEQVIASGQADLCGMTRALICDPEMPNKAKADQLDDIRACIGCNQACIGRAHKGLPISCIQYPQSGRELEFPELSPVERPKQIWVVGGGPAGLKAATTAAERGHRVELFEKSSQLGGQALLAQRLPGRDEFGGIVTNLQREAERAGVAINLNREIDASQITDARPDHVVLATGAGPIAMENENLDSQNLLNYEDVLLERGTIGNRVAIADWRADWIGLGLAEKLAREGCQVKLMVNAAQAGESLQIYTRNHYLGRLYQLGVEVLPHARLYGSEDETVYFQNTLTDEAIIIEADTLVVSLGQQPLNQLEQQVSALDLPITTIGDCLLPRTAEEAVYEGWLAGREIE